MIVDDCARACCVHVQIDRPYVWIFVHHLHIVHCSASLCQQPTAGSLDPSDSIVLTSRRVLCETISTLDKTTSLEKRLSVRHLSDHAHIHFHRSLRSGSDCPDFGTVRDHTGSANSSITLWHPSLFGFNYPLQATNPEQSWNSNGMVNPHRASDNLTMEEWFAHGAKMYPPAPGQFLELPAGESAVFELACNRAWTSYRDPAHKEPKPDYACRVSGAVWELVRVALTTRYRTIRDRYILHRRLANLSTHRISEGQHWQ